MCSPPLLPQRVLKTQEKKSWTKFSKDVLFTVLELFTACVFKKNPKNKKDAGQSVSHHVSQPASQPAGWSLLPAGPASHLARQRAKL